MQTWHDMTIYNRYVSSGDEVYQRTQIRGVEWENRKAQNVIRSGLLAADSVTVYIPLARGANYVKPVAWQALTSKVGKWTLQIGDYLVKGLVSSEISSIFTLAQLKALYDDMVMIDSVDCFDMGSPKLRHWMVAAK